MTNIITDITITDEITLITLDNIPSDSITISNIFKAIADSNINIDMISMTPPYKGIINISFSLKDDDLFNTIKTLKSFKSSIPDLRLEVNSNNCKVSLYGDNMKETPGVFASLTQTLANADIDIKLITTSEVDISYLVYSSDKNKVIKLFNI